MQRLGQRLLAWATDQEPWTNVYGLARSAIALSTALTLAASEASTLFRPAAGIPDSPSCEGLRRFALFCLVGESSYLEWARWLAVLLLLVTASGWRPRLTAIPHWWISYSIQASAITVDGGDQAAAVLSALLLPVALIDPRRWHWRQPGASMTAGAQRPLARLVASSALLACRVQVAAIYFHAAVGKMRVPEWVDGTALYYWFSDPMFGLQEPLLSWVWPLLSNGAVVASLTWSVVVVELVLAIALVTPKGAWPPLLYTGLAFHAGIFLVHGLASFSLTMAGALVLYLRPPEREFTLPASARLPGLLGPGRGAAPVRPDLEVAHEPSSRGEFG